MSTTRTEGNAGMIAVSAFIGHEVRCGRDVTVGAGAVISGHCTIGDGCVIGAGAVLDGGSISTQGLTIEAGVVAMAGSIIEGNLTIGRQARVQAGAVVQRSVPPFAIVSGNPAQIVGYTLSKASSLAAATRPADSTGISPSRVKGVTLHRFPKILDLRGNLTVGEFGRSVPFEPKRYFMVFGVPNAEIRGEHAHRVCEQFLICAQGSCHVVADDGENREEFVLDDPSTGLYLPALTWGIQYKYSPDAVLLVFASHFYDSAEYIRDYNEFSLLTARPH